MESAFRQELTEWQQNRIAVLSQGHSKLTAALRDALLQNDPQSVQGAFNNYLRAIIPDLHLHYWKPRRKSKDKEITDYAKHYHALLLGLCLSLPQAIRVTVEEASGTGRLDMAFDMGLHVVVLELKINRDGHAALTQALTRDYGSAMHGLVVRSRCLVSTLTLTATASRTAKHGTWDCMTFASNGGNMNPTANLWWRSAILTTSNGRPTTIEDPANPLHSTATHRVDKGRPLNAVILHLAQGTHRGIANGLGTEL